MLALVPKLERLIDDQDAHATREARLAMPRARLDSALDWLQRMPASRNAVIEVVTAWRALKDARDR